MSNMKNKITVILYSPPDNTNQVTAELPLRCVDMEAVKARLGVRTLRGIPMSLGNVDDPEKLDNYLPLSPEFEDYQGLMERLDGHRALSDRWIDTYKAALEAELVRNMEEAWEVAQRIECYELIEDRPITDDRSPRVRRLDTGIRALPPLVTSRLYVPMTIAMRPENGRDSRRLGDLEALRYMRPVGAMIWEEQAFSAHTRGYALYNDEYNQILCRKAYSAKASVEELHGRLWITMTILSHGELSPLEQEHMKELVSTALDLGWSAHSDLPAVSVPEGDLTVLFERDGNQNIAVLSEKEVVASQTQAGPALST